MHPLSYATRISICSVSDVGLRRTEIEGTVSAIFFHENTALRYPFPFPYLKDLQAIDPSFVTITKPLRNKSGETFCDGLK